MLSRTEMEKKNPKHTTQNPQRKIAALKERGRDKGLEKAQKDPKGLFFLRLSSELKRSWLLTIPLAF